MLQAFNRDKEKCKVCGNPILGHELETHHINPYLPLNQVNKVPNLAYTHKWCHDLIHITKDFEGKKQPFLEAVFPPKAILIKRLERPFSTKLGKTFEEVAKIAAAHFHPEARTNYRIQGMVDAFAIARIDQMLNLWRENSENKLLIRKWLIK